MKPVLLRTLGFAVPTFAVVVTLHLLKQASAAEAFDGAVSALWFVAFFLIGAWVAQRSGLTRGSGGAASQLSSGAIAGAGVWGALWAFWALPFTASIRLEPGVVLTVNTLSMMLAAWASAGVSRAGVSRASTGLDPN